MEEINLVSESLKFMILGMGIVFLFLVLLIKVLDFQGHILQKYFKQEEIKKDTSKSSNKSNGKSLKVVAAITAAIEHHNKAKG